MVSYGSPEFLIKAAEPVQVVLFHDEGERPKWAAENFPDAVIALRVDDVTSMLSAVRNHIGIARMPCYIGDSDSVVRRLDLEMAQSDWGMWVLSHFDLRSTARVRVSREFLIEVIETQRALILGEQSRYWE